MAKHVCVHGHFYQPFRENPWLEVVEVQDSAAPFHDWNERVAAECYAPNSAARIMGAEGKITDIVNNYQFMSFNFGATLMGWLRAQAPAVHEALIEADQAAIARWGHGGAMAQVYHHLIMPLCNDRDKQTQILWGLADFAHRFGRPAAGMWLAETAVDTPTLELMAQAGVKFTVLAPRQAAMIRPGPDAAWHEIGADGLNTRRPYIVRLRGGRSIVVFFYDGPVSQAVAFENLLQDGARFAQRIMGAFVEGEGGDQLVSLATDGESYGHHHRFGEMALAFALQRIDHDPTVKLTNFAAYLAANPPTWEARIVEASSWSCAHGVERWRADCGCNTGGNPGWNQKWRGPLRQGLNVLRDQLADLFEQKADGLLHDPWAARDDYVRLLLDNSAAGRKRFLENHAKILLDQQGRATVWQLLEMQRWAMAMFTSCGWFFDDISGLEPVQNLRMAARAIQLARELGAAGLERSLVATLSRAQSNRPNKGSGADIWRARVAPELVGLERVAAHAAISGVMEEEPPPPRLYCYQLADLGHRHIDHLGASLSWGALRARHVRIGRDHELIYAALHRGGHEFAAWVRPRPTDWDIDEIGAAAEDLLRSLELERVEAVLARLVGGQRFDLSDLFLEGRRSLAEEMARRLTTRNFEVAKSIYDESKEQMLMLKSINVPLPPLFNALAEAMIGEELVQGMDLPPGRDLAGHLGALARQAKALSLKPNGGRLERALAKRLAACLAELLESPAAVGPLERALTLLDLAQALELRPDLWEAQNHYFELIGSLAGPPSDGLAKLARRLNIAIAARP
ncbi:glycoside hydrolase family 57 [Desulfarculus baarsii DSM 2075]|uniref:Glycoside hydrolase family 57 n=1 Tax=Desulfarculus baarsii (strain ATCC 33931 / DSM 2075 / LMG 7858 / VKM B-1802 / 2st14) TaxID=644282 RepID=E1QE87_DESB2|nr:DUF3536 domain-containing protein [Desulfarculus baarsii]ADK83873.1 glycoside hydrolase family 57 [Desulfarculus baarsii DSM 2075]